MNRRELRTRGRAWPQAIARRLARIGVTPNMVSVASMVFAAGAWYAFDALALVIAAACIQLRLLCNLLDGLLAIEGGLKTRTGDLYNEVPDRIADVVILIGAGQAVRFTVPDAEQLGWACAVAAVLTAYVRLLGGSLGLQQDFSGPMAKQHRMFTLTVGALVAAVESIWTGHVWSLVLALAIVFVGSVFTFARRLLRIGRQLEAR
jgi:phosphatidylglycerophosphate synthase